MGREIPERIQAGHRPGHLPAVPHHGLRLPASAGTPGRGEPGRTPSPVPPQHPARRPSAPGLRVPHGHDPGLRTALLHDVRLPGAGGGRVRGGRPVPWARMAPQPGCPFDPPGLGGMAVRQLRTGGMARRAPVRGPLHGHLPCGSPAPGEAEEASLRGARTPRPVCRAPAARGVPLACGHGERHGHSLAPLRGPAPAGTRAGRIRRPAAGGSDPLLHLLLRHRHRSDLDEPAFHARTKLASRVRVRRIQPLHAGGALVRQVPEPDPGLRKRHPHLAPGPASPCLRRLRADWARVRAAARAPLRVPGGRGGLAGGCVPPPRASVAPHDQWCLHPADLGRLAMELLQRACLAKDLGTAGALRGHLPDRGSC